MKKINDIYKQVEANVNDLVTKNVQWSNGATKEMLDIARSGDYCSVLGLIPTVPKEWIKDIKGKKVLALAGAGGLQGPVLAAGGADVTVLDISENMLEKDKVIAEHENLQITIIHGNMCDLSQFADESFDYIINPTSMIYIPEVMPVFRECYRVLKYGGSLIINAPDPIAYICDWVEDGDEGYYKVINKMPYKSYEHEDQKDWIEFGHTLADYIGGQISIGFVITGYLEQQMEDITDKPFITKADKVRNIP
jgi:2-polyprenyl-3-methyl-5-hydroxy-6-metoxy-1,4-benzoquinol methylase